MSEAKEKTRKQIRRRRLDRLKRYLRRTGRWRQMWHEQGGRCIYCGVPMHEPTGDNQPRSVTLEHIVPRASVPRHSWSNLALACRACNQAKADMDPAEWLGRLAERKGGTTP